MADTFPVKADFLELAITALTKRITQIFGFQCNFVLGEYDRRAESKIEGKIEYPYANLRLTNIVRRNDGGVNRTAARRFGFKTVIEESGQNWFKCHGIPITCDLNLRIVFGDQQDLFRAIHNYFYREHHFNFTLEAAEGAFLIEHNVSSDENFAIQGMEESEYGLNIPYEGTLRMNSWVGEIYRIPMIVTTRSTVQPLTREEVAALEAQGVQVDGRRFFEESNLAVNPVLPVSERA